MSGHSKLLIAGLQANINPQISFVLWSGHCLGTPAYRRLYIVAECAVDCERAVFLRLILQKPQTMF